MQASPEVTFVHHPDTCHLPIISAVLAYAFLLRCLPHLPQSCTTIDITFLPYMILVPLPQKLHTHVHHRSIQKEPAQQQLLSLQNMSHVGVLHMLPTLCSMRRKPSHCSIGEPSHVSSPSKDFEATASVHLQSIAAQLAHAIDCRLGALVMLYVHVLSQLMAMGKSQQAGREELTGQST